MSPKRSFKMWRGRGKERVDPGEEGPTPGKEETNPGKAKRFQSK